MLSFFLSFIEVYLRQLIAGLRNSENSEIRKTAIEAATPLISSTPDDLEEVACDLASALIATNTNIYKDDFSPVVSQALSTLISLTGTPVVIYLIKQLYSSNYNLSSR